MNALLFKRSSSSSDDRRRHHHRRRRQHQHADPLHRHGRRHDRVVVVNDGNENVRDNANLSATTDDVIRRDQQERPVLSSATGPFSCIRSLLLLDDYDEEEGDYYNYNNEVGNNNGFQFFSSFVDPFFCSASSAAAAARDGGVPALIEVKQEIEVEVGAGRRSSNRAGGGWQLPGLTRIVSPSSSSATSSSGSNYNNFEAEEEDFPDDHDGNWANFDEDDDDYYYNNTISRRRNGVRSAAAAATSSSAVAPPAGLTTTTTVDLVQRLLAAHVGGDTDAVLRTLAEWTDRCSNDSDNNSNERRRKKASPSDADAAHVNRMELLFAGGHYVLVNLVLNCGSGGGGNNGDGASGDYEIAMSGLLALMHLALLKESRPLIGSVGGIECVLDQMRAHARREQVQVSGCGILAQLLSTSTDCRYNVEDDSVDGYAARRRQHETATVAAKNAYRLVEYGGIETVLDVLDAYPDQPRVQRYACWAILRATSCLLRAFDVAVGDDDDFGIPPPPVDRRCGEEEADNVIRSRSQTMPSIAVALAVDAMETLQEVLARHGEDRLVSEYAHPALLNVVQYIELVGDVE